jgi:hypothetical protein
MALQGRNVLESGEVWFQQIYFILFFFLHCAGFLVDRYSHRFDHSNHQDNFEEPIKHGQEFEVKIVLSVTKICS